MVKPVFLCGFPKSGTTLLQRLLNSYEDILIWGEHCEFLVPFAQAYFKVCNGRFIFSDQDHWRVKFNKNEDRYTSQGWMNSFSNKEEWRTLAKKYLDSIFFNPEDIKGKEFVGFKEPYYGHPMENQGLEFSLLKDLYPDAIYLFIIRNPFNAFASYGRSLEYPPASRLCYGICRQWDLQNRFFWKLHHSGNIKSFWIKYEDLIEGRGEIVQALKCMGNKHIAEAQKKILRETNGRVSSFHLGSDTLNYNERWKDLKKSWLCLSSYKLSAVASDFGYEVPKVYRFQNMIGSLIALQRRISDVIQSVRKALKK